MYANQIQAVGEILGDLNQAFTKPRLQTDRQRAFRKMQLRSYHFLCGSCNEVTSHKLGDDELYMCEECGWKLKAE